MSTPSFSTTPRPSRGDPTERRGVFVSRGKLFSACRSRRSAPRGLCTSRVRYAVSSGSVLAGPRPAHPRDTHDTIARLVADATPDRRETIDDLRHLRLRQPVDPV